MGPTRLKSVGVVVSLLGPSAHRRASKIAQLSASTFLEVEAVPE
jgi:hypothetical protein